MAAFIPSRYHLAFVNDHVLLWGNLSRLNGLLIILNISMFFLTGLVAQGYYYTFFSLGCLGIVGFLTLLPTPLIRNLWYYLVVLAVEAGGAYFLIVSVVYWISNGG
jgi:hypothetical protein